MYYRVHKSPQLISISVTTSIWLSQINPAQTTTFDFPASYFNSIFSLLGRPSCLFQFAFPPKSSSPLFMPRALPISSYLNLSYYLCLVKCISYVLLVVQFSIFFYCFVPLGSKCFPRKSFSEACTK